MPRTAGTTRKPKDYGYAESSDSDQDERFDAQIEEEEQELNDAIFAMAGAAPRAVAASPLAAAAAAASRAQPAAAGAALRAAAPAAAAARSPRGAAPAPAAAVAAGDDEEEEEEDAVEEEEEEEEEAAGSSSEEEEEDDDSSDSGSDQQQQDDEDEEQQAEEEEKEKASMPRRIPQGAAAVPRQRKPRGHIVHRHAGDAEAAAAARNDNDGPVVMTAILGFLLAGLVGFALPTAGGYPHEHVMGGGFGTLLLFVVFMNVCPSCSRNGRDQRSPVEAISPQTVFIVTACIGIMIGGLIGGAMQWFTPHAYFYDLTRKA